MPKTTQARPLPGLAKLYLLHLYPLALAMLCARFGFAAAGFEAGAEPVVWSLVFFGFGAASIAALAGIHSRSDWAPRYTAGLNSALAILCMVCLVRILIIMADMRIFRYGFETEELFAMLVPAALAMYVPMFFAWRRYFAASPKLAGAFHLDAPEDATLPPLGMGILLTLSASYLLFYLAFFLVLLITGGAKAFSEGGAFILLVTCLPSVVFFIIFLTRGLSPGRKQKPLLTALIALPIIVLLWGYLPGFLLNFMSSRHDWGYPMYSVLHVFSSLPMDNLVMGFLAVMLAWKLWADPAEQAWFAGGESPGRTPAAFSLYNLTLLYYALSSLASGLITISYSFRENSSGEVWPNIIIVAFSVLLVTLQCAAVYNRTAKRWGDKTLSLASFAAPAAICAVVIAIIIINVFSAEEKRYAFYSLSYTIPLYIAPITASLVALLHWRAAYGGSAQADAPQLKGLFALNGPRLAFALFSILLIIVVLSRKAIDMTGYLLVAEDDYIFGNKGGPLELLMNLEFWVAYLACPLLALKWLRSAAAQAKSFYVLGTIWVSAIVASMVNELIGMIARDRYYDFSFTITQVFDPMKQVYIYAIILFMVYLAMSREKTPDEAERR